MATIFLHIQTDSQNQVGGEELKKVATSLQTMSRKLITDLDRNSALAWVEAFRIESNIADEDPKLIRAKLDLQLSWLAKFEASNPLFLDICRLVIPSLFRTIAVAPSVMFGDVQYYLQILSASSVSGIKCIMNEDCSSFLAMLTSQYFCPHQSVSDLALEVLFVAFLPFPFILVLYLIKGLPTKTRTTIFRVCSPVFVFSFVKDIMENVQPRPESYALTLRVKRLLKHLIPLFDDAQKV